MRRGGFCSAAIIVAGLFLLQGACNNGGGQPGSPTSTPTVPVSPTPTPTQSSQPSPTPTSPPILDLEVTFSAGNGPQSIAMGDFNGDGKPDLAVVNQTDDTVSILLNTTTAGATTPTFASQVTFDTGSKPAAAVVGDFNGDGKPDLVVVKPD
jgi:FG-GAP-like repeat